MHLCTYANTHMYIICRCLSILFVPLLLVLNKGNIPEKSNYEFQVPQICFMNFWYIKNLLHGLRPSSEMFIAPVLKWFKTGWYLKSLPRKRTKFYVPWNSNKIIFKPHNHACLFLHLKRYFLVNTENTYD